MNIIAIANADGCHDLLCVDELDIGTGLESGRLNNLHVMSEGYTSPSTTYQLLLLFTKSRRMYQSLLFSSILLTPLTVAPTPIRAQGQPTPFPVMQPLQVAQAKPKVDPFFLTRAKNLARQAAENKNGGLNSYRAEPAMYGPAIDSPFVENEDGSLTFSFKGGPPGFTAPTLETVATVTPPGIVNISYNGPVRPATAEQEDPQPPSTPADTNPVPPEAPSQIIDQIKELVK
jgi:hypothetical protein